MSDMNIYQALLAAQRDFGPVLRNATNPAFRSKYADLSSVIETITGPLHANGLVVVQRLDYEQHGETTVPVLLTELIHADTGERLTSRAVLACKDPLDPQKVGAAISYFRRYSLLALLGLSTEDDDGNAAARPATPAKAAQAQQNGPSAPERPAVAAEGYKPRPAPRTDAELLAIAADEGAMLPRREHAAKAYLARATDPFGAEERAAAVRRIADFDGRDVDAWRDAALGALRENQPASYAG
jgi:hypothetical protein